MSQSPAMVASTQTTMTRPAPNLSISAAGERRADAHQELRQRHAREPKRLAADVRAPW